MAIPTLPPDFKEFLKLLTDHQVEYLLIGGYAVGYYGYVRATVDMDVWIAVSSETATRIVAALREFGFDVPDLNEELFLQDERIIRMGVPPLRLEIHTGISGVRFAECYERRVEVIWESVPVSLIALAESQGQ